MPAERDEPSAPPEAEINDRRLDSDLTVAIWVPLKKD